MKFEFIVMWKEAIVGHLNKYPGGREAKEKKHLRDFRLTHQCSAQKSCIVKKILRQDSQ